MVKRSPTFPITPETLSLQLLFKVDALLAEKIAALGWADEIDVDESGAISQLHEILTQDRDLANQLAGMPFFSESIEQHDTDALFWLRRLGVNYQSDLELVREQRWFQDGLTDTEAIFIPILVRHADLRTLEIFGKDDFRVLATGDFVDKSRSDIIATPLSGTVKLISFNLPEFFVEEFLSLVSDAVRTQEEIIGEPFPVDEIPILFTPPPESKTSNSTIIGFFVGTHIIVEPSLAIKDAKRIVTHELAHYYLSGSANRGLPLWFGEGGPDFTASFLMAQTGVQSIPDRKRDFGGFSNSEVAYCDRSLGVPNIQKLLDFIERDGYYEHRDSQLYVCNYILGEHLFLILYEAMGQEHFTAAMNQIYNSAKTADRLITEEEIYQAFLRHTPKEKISDFQDIYDRWHGGRFSGGG